MDNLYGYPSYQPNLTYSAMQTPLYQRNWQQPYQTTTLPSYQQNNAVNGAMIWIQGGEASAKAYQNPQPNIPIALWDSEDPVIYIKSIDQNGRPQITILDYKQRDNNQDNNQKQPTMEYATTEQIEELNKQFSMLNERLNSLNQYVTKDQLDGFNSHIDNLSEQIKDIENRIANFSKPQQSNTNRRGGK